MQVRGETVDEHIRAARDGNDHMISMRLYRDSIDGDHRRG
jgi:hypothetical protein